MKKTGFDKPAVLLTGGAGYIGSVVIRQILQNNIRVVVFDNLSFGGESLLSLWSHPDFDFVRGDITAIDSLQTVFKNYNISDIIHLAAIVGDPACQKFPELAIDVNRHGSDNLLEMAQANNINKFIFASTCSNYGKMTDHDSYVDESSPLKPVSLYAELKVEFEQKLLNLNDLNLKPVCLRFATAFGLSTRPRFDLTLNEFTRDLFFNKKLQIYGEHFWRPYCHTTDLARAVLLALTTDEINAKEMSFNVGSTEANYTKKDLADFIVNQLPDRSDLIEYIAKDEDPRDYRVSFEKINETFNFKTNVSVEQGISELINLFEANIIKDCFDKKYTNC